MKLNLPLELKLDYSDAQLVVFTQPPLACVLPWIQFKAQNMLEPTWRQELQCIREDADIRYIAAMLILFHHWKLEQGLWPILP